MTFKAGLNQSSDFFGCEYDSLNGLKLKIRSNKVESADKNEQKLQVVGKDKKEPLMD